MSTSRDHVLDHPISAAVLTRRRSWLLIAGVWMAFIFWTSHRSWEGAATNIPSGVSNLVHLFFYGALGGALALGFGGARRAATRLPGLYARAVVVATLWGACDEIHQRFVTGRTCSLFDVVVDAHGAWLAVAVLSWARGGFARPRRALTLGALVGVSAVAFCTVVPRLFPGLDDL